MKSKGKYRAISDVTYQDLHGTIYDVFDLPDAHVRFFGNPLESHSINQPEFQNIPVFHAMNGLIDQKRDL